MCQISKHCRTIAQRIYKVMKIQPNTASFLRSAFPSFLLASYNFNLHALFSILSLFPFPLFVIPQSSFLSFFSFHFFFPSFYLYFCIACSCSYPFFFQEKQTSCEAASPFHAVCFLKHQTVLLMRKVKTADVTSRFFLQNGWILN